MKDDNFCPRCGSWLYLDGDDIACISGHRFFPYPIVRGEKAAETQRIYIDEMKESCRGLKDDCKRVHKGVMVKCAWEGCGKEFFRASSLAKKVYCSHECSRQANIQHKHNRRQVAA